jgi:hypothetical protein
MSLRDLDTRTPLPRPNDATLAIVRSGSDARPDEHIASALGRASLTARPATLAELCSDPGRFAGVIAVGDSALAVAPFVLRLRETPEGVGLPVLAWPHDATGGLVDPEWIAYADGLLDGTATPADGAAALARLGRIAGARSALSLPVAPDPTGRRRLAILQYLLSRQLGRLDPRRAPSRPLGHSYAPLDRLGYDLLEDLDALARVGLLQPSFFERLHVCARCGDARLAFREVCTGCRSADLLHGETLHHYACGHVGPEEHFHRDGALVCPSCSEPLRHVGIDFERPASLVQCNACGLGNGEGTTAARCLACGAASGADETGSRILASYQLTAEGLAAARAGDLRLLRGMP